MSEKDTTQHQMGRVQEEIREAQRELRNVIDDFHILMFCMLESQTEADALLSLAKECLSSAVASAHAEAFEDLPEEPSIANDISVLDSLRSIAQSYTNMIKELDYDLRVWGITKLLLEEALRMTNMVYEPRFAL